MRKALAIGINNYPTAPLSGCINDAKEISKYLEKHENNKPNFDTRLELDVSTKSILKSMIVELFKGDNDTALLYFSGHGFLNEFGGYIVTPDYAKYDEGISMDEILILANQSSSTDKIIILDCCHSGAFGSPRITGGATHIKDGVTILTASRDDESSIEIGEHGVFTNLLIEALKGGAADIRGYISPGSIYAYIDKALGSWDQRPIFKTNVSRFTSLREVNPQVPIEVIRKIIEYFPNHQDEFSLNPSFEFTNSPDIEHQVIKPYAKPENVSIFKDLQRLEGVGLIVPTGEEHMYFAAMNFKSCQLTSLGKHYWRLVKNNRI